MHPDSRVLGAPLSRHHLEPGLLGVGEDLRQSDGDSHGNRQDLESLGHT